MCFYMYVEGMCVSCHVWLTNYQNLMVFTLFVPVKFAQCSVCYTFVLLLSWSYSVCSSLIQSQWVYFFNFLTQHGINLVQSSGVRLKIYKDSAEFKPPNLKAYRAYFGFIILSYFVSSLIALIWQLHPKMYSIWKYVVSQFSGNLKATSELCHIQLCALLTVVMMEVCKSLFFFLTF